MKGDGQRHKRSRSTRCFVEYGRLPCIPGEEHETKGRTETIRRTDHNELLIIGAKVDRKNIGGVGFLVNSTVHHLVDSYKIIGPRAVLRLETKDQGTISIINGYAPTSVATDEEKEEF
ncbi:unnamed protein product [Heligmosomoides polygyrus]|uniref:PDZ domain-containing protein n=1 Tax=Heligmosomoides polygyrus TaxID=6339 RepID=A0A183G6N2_HELPZ|nr:unnamed protein product [Heligmosomoides polygyrus]